MKLLVYIVHHGRLPLLQRCCRSLVPALPDGARVFILLNGLGLPAERWLESFGHPAFSWASVPTEHRCLARNRAFLDRWGDIIHFLDDDVEVPPFLFRETLDRFRRDPGLVGLGGPNLTPVDSPWREHAFGAAMTSPFAAPLVRARYEGKSRQIAGPAAAHRLILCTLAVRRAAIPQDLTFRDRLLSNEENLFFHACAERGLKLAFCPRLYVYHARRPYLGPFARQLFKYGSGRGQQGRLCWRSSPPLFYAPAIAWALAIGLVGIARTDWLAAVLAVYALGSFLGALASPTARALGFRGVIAVTSLTPLVHGAYGLGLWWGAAGAPSWDLLRRIPARASWRIWRDWVGVARPLHQEG